MIEDNGQKLEKYLSVEMLRGIMTGLNDAFIIDQEIRDKIVNKDPSSEEVISKIMTGEDIKKYLAGFSNQYLIRIPSGWTKTQSGYESEDEAWDWFSSKYPGVSEHLIEFVDDARSRYDQGEFWWELRPCDYYDAFEAEKIVYPEISNRPQFSLDTDGKYTNNKCFIIPVNDPALVGILNSSLGEFWADNNLSTVRGGYLEYRTVHLSKFPVPLGDKEELNEPVENIVDLIASLRSLNLELLDHLGSYDDGQTLEEIGFAQPPAGAADSILTDTAADRDNLRVGSVDVIRTDDSSLEIHLSARYKPPEEDAADYDTDRWGYTETALEPALRLSELSPTEADLIEAFVPYAVDEAGGFADFRETATKTMSLVDRLQNLTLPAVDDVETGLERYLETKSRAEDLEAKIERTDELIDQIVYDLYGLTEEEIAIVEDAVNA